ncbi:MAG: 2OG-Fe(II) oxygenase [Sphingomonadaceae bacterium]|nr:2OG-Fe(II) oxygenase [Sphingomonadaceae bacterium]
MTSLSNQIDALDWSALSEMLDERGYALTPPILSPDQCSRIAALYDRKEGFRSTVVMARHGFGKGEYRYFAYPLPPIIARLREALYPHLAQIANRWSERLGQQDIWPSSHSALIDRCHAFGQSRPTPLLLSYREGDYNCLHQDLYGPIHFPLQAVIMLSPPEAYSGGALTLVENRPRMQSRAEVVPASQGQIAIIPVKDRPRKGANGWSRSAMRHGVSTVLSGRRQTLGIIFHDAS